MKKLLNGQKITSHVVLVLLSTALIFGCTSNKAEIEATENRRITDILTTENAESFNITVKGDRYLIYSAVTQSSPRGVVLHFPDTALENIKSIYTPATNEFISSIETREIVGEKETKSIIFLALKKKAPYELSPMGAEMQISFSKAKATSEEVASPKTIDEKKSEPAKMPIKQPVAKRLQDVVVAALEDKVIVKVKADGVIKDYKSFTLSDPARIVIDMYNLKSPYTGEKIIAVESNMVDQVRHCVHPDKVRLVLDMHKDNLKNYSATQAQNGLFIRIRSAPGSQSE